MKMKKTTSDDNFYCHGNMTDFNKDYVMLRFPAITVRATVCVCSLSDLLILVNHC